ncbi:MAG: ABC transporter permease subunit [Chloroflexi bacterium]|nr:ABC transporter permease subunit [Chloroflexota bacterium]
MTGTAVTGDARAVNRPGRFRSLATWLGVVPFFLFALAFLFVPTIRLIAGSFQDRTGAFTLANYEDFNTKIVANAYTASIEISLVTALAAGVFGFLMAYAVISGGLPRIFRSSLMTFSGVAANFAGIPLALAFIFTIGRAGFLTAFLRGLGIDPYRDGGFTLYSKIGLEIVYLYFQLPLMILIIAPAIDGLKKDWREASENLGASSAQFWRHVGLPVLMPSLLGAVVLLFGNAFGAQATAYQLTGGLINLVTLLIGDKLSGDVLHEPGKGFALAVGMIVIMAVTLVAYIWLSRRSERWKK